MSDYDLHFLQDSDISRAWARALLRSLEPGVASITPFVVRIGLSDKAEEPKIRRLADLYLTSNRLSPVLTVANTIFPSSYWNPAAPRGTLYERYINNLPTIRRLSRRNRYGLYFERLIAFGPNQVNQLEHIISTYGGGNHRKSALQAAIFDPNSDHTNQRQRGFPCLQQVSFSPDAKRGTLAVTGYFATQYLDTKGYGNYLGLYRLGTFMAHELGLKLLELNCIASAAGIRSPKTALHSLAADLSALLRETEPGSRVLETEVNT